MHIKGSNRTLRWIWRVIRCFGVRRHQHKLVSSVDRETSDEGVHSTTDSAVLELDLHSLRARGHNISLYRLAGPLTLLLAVVEMELVQREVFHRARMRNRTKKIG